MIKKYNDFILENFSIHFDNEYNEFIDIYQNQIVPKIGEVEVFTNFMLDGVLEKSQETRFHNLRGNLRDARSEFSDSIKTLSIRFFKSSFSSLASSKDSKPDEDFEEMQRMLNRAGFTLDILKKLFNPIVSVFTSQDFHEFIERNSLDETNGYIDIYLYKLNEKLDLNTTVYLGGEGWGYVLETEPDEEYVIKYAYGYHKTPYGKLFLDQMGISKDEFVTTTYQYLRDSFRESLYPNIMIDLKKMVQTGYTSTLGDIFMPEDFDDFVTLDDDRFIISYVEMCNDFNDITDNKYENIADPDWFKETILKSMSIFSGINIQDTGEELIFNDYEEN
jgi:hypothetical protein